VKRRIREREYVFVRVSARRILIDAERSPAFTRSDGTKATIAEYATEVTTWSAAEKRRTQQREAFIAECVRELARLARDNRGTFFNVPEIARLSKQSCRHVYYDVREGALPKYEAAWMKSIRIRWCDAIRYINRPDATDAIITIVVSRLFGDPDVSTRAEIARGFAAWWLKFGRRV